MLDLNVKRYIGYGDHKFIRKIEGEFLYVGGDIDPKFRNKGLELVNLTKIKVGENIAKIAEIGWQFMLE